MRGRYPVLLLGLSIAVLAAGTLIRRRAETPKPERAPVDLEILQRLTADRRLRDLSGYLSERAHMAARRLSPAGFAWNAQTLLAAPDRPGMPFAVRHQASNLPPVVPVRPRPGDWLLAVVRDSAGEPVFVHGLFEGIARERCGAFEYDAVHFAAPLAPTMIGGGVFLIDGGTAAFIGSCEGRPIAIASSTIADSLAHPPSPADLMEERYGFRRDDQGLVTSVWDNSDAERAGLRAGDLIDPAGDPPAEARRGRRTVRLSWPEPNRQLGGMTLRGDAVVAVAPGSPAETAGIRTGDLLIDNSSATLERAKGPVTITIERNGRRRETLLQP